MTKKPKVIIVTGRPGSGKTTLAKKLGELVKLPVISRDEIKEGYVNTFGKNHKKLPNANKEVTNIFFSTLRSLLSKDVSVVGEAAFQHSVWGKFLKRISSIADVLIIICKVDDNVAARRHLKRGLEDESREFYHGDYRVSHFKRTKEFLGPAEYLEPNFRFTTIKVSTKNGYSPSLNSIRRKILKK